MGPRPAGVVAVDWTGDGLHELAAVDAGRCEKRQLDPACDPQAQHCDTAELCLGRASVLENHGDFLFTLDGTYDLGVEEDFGRSPVAVALANLNDDSEVDIVVSDPGRGELVILRKQPPPCATYLTMPIHGGNMSGDSNFGWLDDISVAAGDRTAQINAARRPGAQEATGIADLCPVKHVAVNGHWESDATSGQPLVALSRVGWVTSSYLVWAPGCRDPIPPGPALEPIMYWASALWMLAPTNLIACPPPLFTDRRTPARFALGGLSWGIEALGGFLADSAAHRAAIDLSLNLEDATAQARATMDRCTGNVFVDVVGLSRGGGVGSGMLGNLRTTGRDAGLRYNAALSFISLDGTDPVVPGPIRPWAKVTSIVGGPEMQRHGNETVFSYESNDLGVPADAWPWSWLYGVVAPYGATPSDIVGSPVGSPRQAQLQVCPALMSDDFYGQQMLTHFDYAPLYLNQDGASADESLPEVWTGLPANAPDEYQDIRQTVTGDPALDVNYASSSHFGVLLRDPRSPIPNSDLPGWLPLEDGICAYAPAQPPEECPDGVPAGTPTSEAFALSSSSYIVRELVRDPMFFISRGVIRNAQDFLAEYPSSKEFVQDAVIGDWLDDFIDAAATDEFVPDGVWRRELDVKIKGAGETSLPLATASAIADPAVSFDTIDVEEAETLITARIAQLDQAPASEQDETVRYGAATQGGALSKGSEAFARFPNAGSGAIEQDLHLESLRHEELLVRVELEFSDIASSELRVELIGEGLVHLEELSGMTTGTNRTILEFVATRPYAASGKTSDIIRLEGMKVQVYGVSVVPLTYARVEHKPTNRYYEVVTLPEGVDWQTARKIALRRTYMGISGRLARISDPSIAAYIQSNLDVDVPVWIGAWGPADRKHFYWPDDSQAPLHFWDVDQPAKFGSYDRYVFLDPDSGGLRTSKATSTRDGRPFGFIVEY